MKTLLALMLITIGLNIHATSVTEECCQAWNVDGTCASETIVGCSGSGGGMMTPGVPEIPPPMAQQCLCSNLGADGVCRGEESIPGCTSQGTANCCAQTSPEGLCEVYKPECLSK